MISRNAQVALEYMLVVATLLVLTALMLGYTLPAYNNAVKTDQMNNAVITLTLAAEKAYSLGPGSVIISEINLPENVESFLVQGNAIHAVFEGSTTLVVLDFNVSGSIPVSGGHHKIRAAAVDENVVFSEVV